MCNRALACFATFIYWPTISVAALRPDSPHGWGRLPLVFEADPGSGGFMARTAAGVLFFGACGEVRVRGASDKIAMSLAGANPRSLPRGMHPMPGRRYYFTGGTEARRPGAALFTKLVYRDVYPGVDLIFYGVEGALEYDLVISPGSSPENIRMRFPGWSRIAVESGGDLVLSSGSGRLMYRRPRVYQQIGHARVEVSGGYSLRGSAVRFEIGSYREELPLVIDPVLSYSTVLGGKGDDRASGVATDAAGSIYVAGNTWSADYPKSAQAYRGSLGNRDIFVTKLNSAGDAILFSAVIGGSGQDSAQGMAIDPLGNVYVTGFTLSRDFPTTPGALQTLYRAQTEAFLIKLNATGSSLVYSTLLGGTGENRAAAVAVDATGAVWVVGCTSSVDLPTTPNAVRRTYGGGFYDAFTVKLNPSGSGLLYSTYLGGKGNDIAVAVALNSSGGAHIAGQSDSANFPMRGGLQVQNHGLDAFAVKLDPAGVLVYSTFLGGRGPDYATAAATDAQGHLYIAGVTMSADFPVTSRAYRSVNAGEYDGFVSKLSPNGDSLVYSTYLGGSASESLNAIAVTNTGRAVVAGTTNSFDLPVRDAVQSPTGGGDAFVTMLNEDGTDQIFGTYLGGTGADAALALACDTAGARVYVAGYTFSTQFPRSAGAASSGPSGHGDVFLARLDLNSPPIAVSVTPASGSGDSQTFAFTFSDNDGYADIGYAVIIINSTLNGGNACFLLYEPAANAVILVNDNGTATTRVTLGSSASAANSQCAVHTVASSASFSGTTIVLRLALNFQPSFAGAKGVYFCVHDIRGNVSDVVLGATWTVPGKTNQAPAAVSVTPASGAGASQKFSVVFSDGDGYQDFALAVVLINSALTGNYGCFLLYDPANNAVALLNDNGTAAITVALGSNAVAANSQCSLRGADSSSLRAGFSITLNLALSFTPQFAGTKNIYLYAQDRSGMDTGTQIRGTWSIPAQANHAPVAVSVTPSSGSGASQTFRFQFSDQDGAADIDYVVIIANAALDGYNACFLLYAPAANTVWLMNDNGTVSMPVPLGSAATAANGQCSISGPGSSAASPGSDLILNLALAWQPRFAGKKNFYLFARDHRGMDSGAEIRGTWIVP